MVGAPAFVLLNVGVSKVLANPEARYGLSLLPFMAAIVASYARNRIGTTLLWLGIAVYIAFVLRYRSFSLGALAMLRYARYALAFLWRWIRGRPFDAVSRPAEPVTKIVREYQKRVPLGHVSMSEQLNVLIILLLVIMAHL